MSPDYVSKGTSVTINIDDTKKITTKDLLIAKNQFITATISSTGTGYLYFTGEHADRKLYGGVLTNIDASETTTPVYTWQGTATNCVNIYAVDGEDIGGGASGGVSITEL